MSDGGDLHYRIGIIGTGRWGQNIIRSLMDFPEVEIVWVARSSTSRPSFVPPDVAMFTDWRSAISSGGKIDAIFAAVPPHLHDHIAIAANEIAAHLWLEKPMALSLTSAQVIFDLFDGHSNQLFIDHTYLFNSAFKKLKDLVEISGPIHRIHAEAGNSGPYRESVEIAWDWLPHDLAMANVIYGQCPEELTIRIISREQKSSGFSEHIEVLGKFPCGATFSADISNDRKERVRRLFVECENDSFLIEDNNSLNLWRIDDETKSLISSSEERSLTNAISAFFECISNNNIRYNTPKIGLEVVKCITNSTRTSEGFAQ